jgi:16S rRNA (adenine1518-N6/adenine1519-N6)-dimethyltransferase
MTDATPRQTLSYLRQLFQERHIQPKNKLGQNFLIDLNLLDTLTRTAELTKEHLVLEVGCGTGSLTSRLSDQAGAVLAVEIDPTFFVLAQETIGERSNVLFVHADVLKNKNEINPTVLEALADLQKRSGRNRLKLVANLPYAVATPVIANFLLTGLAFEDLVVTVQWEIAERLIARPSTKDYGALAVMVQSLADVTIIRQLPPTVFFPRPQVSSAIVQIRPNAAKRAQVGEVARLRSFLRDLYSHRRKNLRGALCAMPSRRSKSDVDRQLADLGIEGTVRAEDLDREQHLRLCAAFG